jgi:hypothetical protein
MVLELFLKVVLTIGMSVFFLLGLRWVWTNQLDVPGTVAKFVQQVREPPGWVATRDLDKIYQEGKSVGDVTGEVRDVDGRMLFTQLTNTGNLDQKAVFEYRRIRLRICQVGTVTGMKSSVIVGDSGAKSVTLTAVMEDVLCDIVP